MPTTKDFIQAVTDHISTLEQQDLQNSSDPGKSFKIKDGRKVDSASGLPITDKNRQDVDVNPELTAKIIKEAKAQGVDPYTALAVAHQETKLGTHGEESEGNPFHILEGAKTSDPIKEGISILKNKLEYGKKLGKKTEAEQIQAYNGYGKVGMNTEGKQKSMYGIDLSKGNLDMNTNPVYGKRIMDIRDNILKQHPEIKKMVEGEGSQTGVSNYTRGGGPPDIEGDPVGGGGKPPVELKTLDIPNKTTLDEQGDVRDIINEFVGKGKNLQVRDRAGLVVKLQQLLGNEKAVKVLDHMAIFNSQNNNKTPEQRINSFYNTTSKDKDVSEVVERAKNLGLSDPLTAMRSSEDILSQELAGKDLGKEHKDNKSSIIQSVASQVTK